MSSICYLESLVHYILGYFTTGYRMTQEELEAVQGRMWEELVATFMEKSLDTNVRTASTTKIELFQDYRITSLQKKT